MAQTEKGIIYPYDYNEVADVPSDFKALAESIDALLNDYSLNTDSGNKIVLEMNNTTYKIKAVLKDKDNNVISTSNEIDLPLENMVTNISYDEQTLTLTHQDGQTTEVSIADLISDLASKEEVEELQSQVDDLETLVETELDSNTVEGTEIDVSDSAEYPGKIIPGANLEQASYNGYNIMASPYQSRTTVTQYTNILYNVDTENRIQANKTYTVSVKGKPGDKYRVTGGQYGVADTSVIFTIDTNGIGIATFTTKNEFTSDSTGILSNYTADNTLPLTDICIAEGTYNELPFEPYCGGQASPNPDYPQEIKVVTGDNVIKHVGKNLFNKSSTVEGVLTENGTISSGSQYVTSDFIKIDSQKTYTKTATNSARVKFYDANKNVISNASFSDISNFGTPLTFTIPYANAKYIRYSINKSILDTQQLEEGTTATSYEPYRCEDYHLGLWKENEFNSTNATIYNALLNDAGFLASSDVNKTAIVSCQPNKTYKISKIAGKRLRVAEFNTSPSLGDAYTNRIKNDEVASLVFKTSGTANYLAITYYSTAVDTLTEQEILNSIQIQEAIELCKIDDYQDILFKNLVGDENYNAELEDGAWYKKGVVIKDVLDSSENWAKNGTNRYSIEIPSKDGDYTLPAYCDKFINAIDWNMHLATDHSFVIKNINWGENHCRISFIDSDCLELQDWKEFVSENNLTVYRPLKSVEYKKITDPTLISQLEALKKAKWYKGVNHWWTETENLEPNLKGTYKQSNNLRIKEQDERLDNLESRLALLE